MMSDLMGDLVLLLLRLLGGGLEASSDRGLVAIFAAGSLASFGWTTWLLTTSPDPLKSPAWAPFVLVGSIVVGAAGMLVSALHLWRNDTGRALGLVSLIANVAALV